MIVFLASWFGLSLVFGALWSIAGSRGGIVSKAGHVPVRTNAVAVPRHAVELRRTA